MALYMQLGNLRVLRRVSMLRCTSNKDNPTHTGHTEELPLVSSLKEDQFSAAVVDQVSWLKHGRTKTSSQLRASKF